MYEWYIQKDGKVTRMSEAQLRAELRKGKRTGLELARRADHSHWYPLHDTHLYREEVAFEGSPVDHARLQAVRGFGVHLLIFVLVNVVVVAAPVFALWGIAVVLHGARTFPAAQALYREGKFPLLRSASRPALPPASSGSTGTRTAPYPLAAPTPARQTTPYPVVPASSRATDPYATTGTVDPADPSASASLPYDPTIGVAGRSVPSQQLRASVRGRLFGEASAPPVQVGRYRLLEEIGAGGMGIVYRAHDESLDRTVALKLLRSEVDTDAGTERLQREARSMAKVSHPNVVTVFDVGVFDGAVFLAMEFVRGRTLRAWLDDARAVGDIVAVLRQAAEGLAAAHDNGLVHRDFKPENVIVGDDGRVRVLDFGLAKPVDQSTTHDMLTRTGTILGTPRYMAPEQFRGEPADAASDQFALSVVAHEAIFGMHPYQPVDAMPLPRAVLKGLRREAPRRPDVPNSIRDAIARAAAHDPDARYASIRDMLAAFGPPPTTSNDLAALIAVVRRLLARRADGPQTLAALDSIEATVAELDSKAAALAALTPVEASDHLDRELDAARAVLKTAATADAAMLQRQIAAIEQRKVGIVAAQQVVARLRTRRSVAESQLKQLHLDLTRAEVDDADDLLPSLTGPLEELRFQVDAAQEVEAFLAGHPSAN